MTKLFGASCPSCARRTYHAQIEGGIRCAACGLAHDEGAPATATRLALVALRAAHPQRGWCVMDGQIVGSDEAAAQLIQIEQDRQAGGGWRCWVSQEGQAAGEGQAMSALGAYEQARRAGR